MKPIPFYGDHPWRRPDGRPEAYAILPDDGSTAQCFTCLQAGNDVGHAYGTIFMCSPIDNAVSGEGVMVCLNHLPDDIVIYDPKTNECRDKSGQNTWTET